MLTKKQYFLFILIASFLFFTNCDTPAGNTNGGTTPPADPTDRFIAVGNNGIIIYSDDYGLTFTSVNSGTTEPLRDVTSDGYGNCVAVGDNGTFRYSSNYGLSWQTGTLITGVTTNHINSVTSYGENKFIAVGEATGNYPDGIYRSTNGGQTWDKYCVTIILNGVAVLSSTVFVTVGHIYGVDDGVGHISSNGGTSWSMLTQEGSTPAIPSGTRTLNKVIHTAGNTCIAVGMGGSIYSPGGYAWSTGGSVSGELNGVAYSDTAGRSITVGSGTPGGVWQGAVYDAGSVGGIWTKITLSETASPLNDVATNRTNRFVAVGRDGEVISSTDTSDPFEIGKSWVFGTSGVTTHLWGVGYVALN